MRVAVVGAGFSGLAAAIELVDRRVKVEVYDSSDTVGGLACGVKEKGWKTSLEKYYHHIFTNDKDIISVSKKVGLSPTFYTPKTCSFLNKKILTLDSPLSVLQFSEISLRARLQMGFGLAILKLIPNGLFLEKHLVTKTLPKFIGREAYDKVWERLLAAKFGKKMTKVNLAWFWSRVAKRTRSLGYFEGGFQALADKMKDYIEKKGGVFYLNKDVSKEDFESKNYDKVIITTPGPIANKILGKELIPKIDYLWAQTVVLELRKSFMDCYWLNILEKNWPFLVVVEHTNMIGTSKFGERTILYLGNYLDKDDTQLKTKKEELIKIYEPFLKKINSNFEKSWITRSFLFRSPYSQPIFPINYSKELERIGIRNGKYFFTNMSMVYPFDRGTNYAVKLGKQIAIKCLA